MIGCGGEPRVPTDFGDHQGTNGRANGTSPVIGQWRNIWIVQVPEDFQTWTTEWTYDADGSCLLRKTFRSLLLAFPQVTARPCTFSLSAFIISVQFLDTGMVQPLDFSFPASSRDRMILEGLTYDRIE